MLGCRGNQGGYGEAEKGMKELTPRVICRSKKSREDGVRNTMKAAPKSAKRDWIEANSNVSMQEMKV